MYLKRPREVGGLLHPIEVNKRRLLSCSEFSEAQVLRRRLWFDILPADIYDCIAAMVTNGQQSLDALNLAVACPELRRPVASALAFQCVISPSTLRPAEWAQVLAPYITELRMLHHFEPSAFLMCKARSLRTAHITDDARSLRAIAFNWSLRSLHICIRNSVQIPQLLTTLASLRLSVLVLNIDMQTSINCPFHPANPDRVPPSRLQKACPLVTALFVKCSHTHAPEECPQFALMAEFPCLQMAVLDKDSSPPPAAIPLLRRISKVNILCTKNALQLAVAIGPVVVRLKIPELVEEGQIASIVRCPNLIELALSVKPESNYALLNLCSSLQSLRSLRVVYAWDGIYTLTPNMRKWWLGLPMAWTAGIFPGVARGLPLLSHLSLYNAFLPIAQVEEVLMTIGSRLESFIHSVFDQDESPYVYCEKLLYAVWRFNPKLRQLWFNSYRLCTRQIEALRNAIDADGWTIDAQRRRIEVIREKLASKNPSLRIYGLDSVLNLTLCDFSTTEARREKHMLLSIPE